ncbi:MAG: 30S ribosomal protein S4 [Bdellovibrionota bacterium]
MARYNDSVCRLCRREGEKLYLKGARCYSEKCAVERRQYAPGQHGQARTKLSDYGQQLREKQKVKRLYGVLERPFENTFTKASRMKGVTGENLLALLERRLDTAVHRLGFARSRPEARQLIRHGHFKVNGIKVNVPSYVLRAGDRIEVTEALRKNPLVVEGLERASRGGSLPWLELHKEEFAGIVTGVPSREELPTPVRDVREQLIVELYSK